MSAVTGKTTTTVEVEVPMQEIRNLLRAAGYWIPTSADVICLHGQSPRTGAAGEPGGLRFRWEKTESIILNPSDKFRAGAPEAPITECDLPIGGKFP